MAIVAHSLALPKHFDREPSPADFAEYAEWCNTVERSPLVECYPDESPELPAADYFEPDEDDLAWLESQRAACEDMPGTLDELNRQINSLRRHLIISEVASFLASSRFGGHDCREDDR